MSTGLVDIELYLLNETEGAIRVAEDEQEEGVWLPKSQVEIERRTNSRIVTITLPQWLAENRKLV